MPGATSTGTDPAGSWPRLVGLIHRALGDASHELYARYLLDIISAWLTSNLSTVSISTLPALVARACGGGEEEAGPVTEVWQVVRLALKLLDDAEDGDAGEDLPLVINAASGLLFTSQLLLAETPAHGLAIERAGRLGQSLNAVLLEATAGQHRDLLAGRSRGEVMQPDDWLAVAVAKSGAPLGWAAWAGALVAGASDTVQDHWRVYGQHLGILLQVADDFAGVWGAGRANDLARGGQGLPVCYARHVLDVPARRHLDAWLAQAGAGDRAAEGEAKRLITAAGAQGYLLVVAEVQCQAARGAARQAGVEATPHGQALLALLDAVLPALQHVRRM